MPPAGPGRVLITSRNQIWPPGKAVDVPVLDPQVAAEFLVGRTGDVDRRAALDLAGELGWLPLALEQAAAYVQASGESLARYLASFRKRRPEMLARGVQRDGARHRARPGQKFRSGGVRAGTSHAPWAHTS